VVRKPTESLLTEISRNGIELSFSVSIVKSDDRLSTFEVPVFKEMVKIVSTQDVKIVIHISFQAVGL